MWHHPAALTIPPRAQFPRFTCRFGTRTATAYWHMIMDGDEGSAFMDKPVYYRT